MEVLLFENSELSDKARHTDFHLVHAVTQQKVEQLSEIGAVIAKDILHITDDVLLSQVALLLDELRLQVGCLLLLVGEIVEEPLEKRQVLLIVVHHHRVAYPLDLWIEERAWTQFLVGQLQVDLRLFALGCGLLMFLLCAVCFASEIEDEIPYYLGQASLELDGHKLIG